MTKFKVGDKVLVRGQVQTVRSIPGDKIWIEAGMNIDYGVLVDNGLLNGRGEWLPDDWIKKFDQPKTLDNLEVGDILIDDDTDVMVLGVCGKLYFISEDEEFDSSRDVPFTAKELKDFGFKIKQPTPEKPETIEIEGKTYARSDIESALKDVKALN